MDIELHNKLITDGYYSFNLDNEIKDKLKPIAKKLKELEFKRARHTGCGETDSTTDSFENLEKLKEIYAPLKVWQFWYENSEYVSTLTKDEYDFLYELFTSLIEKFYPKDSYSKPFFINCTLFNKLCYINNHQDGTSGHRLTNILIYLNEDYLDGMGGEIIIHDRVKVTPDLGNVAILDFSKNNPRHAVTEVKDDNFRRITLLVELAQNNEK